MSVRSKSGNSARFARETDIYSDSPRLGTQCARTSRMNIYIQMVYINSTQRKKWVRPGIHPPLCRRYPPEAVTNSPSLRHNRIAHYSLGSPSTFLCASSFFLALLPLVFWIVFFTINYFHYGIPKLKAIAIVMCHNYNYKIYNNNYELHLLVHSIIEKKCNNIEL